MSLVWLGEATKVATNDAKIAVHGFYQGEASKADYEMGEKAFLEREFSIIHRSSMEDSVVAFGMFLLALGIMLHNYSIMNKRALEKQQELDVIRDISNRDPLTGVKSKHAYAEQEHLLNVMISGGRIKEFSVVVCDVNGLKKVNDTLGHKAGDEYIRSASTLICECFKHSPVFRTGGDEFVVVLTGHDFINRNKNLDKLNEISVANRDRGGVVVAAGLADFLPEKDRDLSSVFERADAIMYAKKKALKGMAS
jgi:diguanylate cyclase (GGDEF)-like protein